jgi:dipeptidyl aminopeptidase/acylaminoacyl peptidase
MNISRITRSTAGAALAALAIMAACPAGAAPIPLQDFFRPATAVTPRLSPAGDKIALLIPAPDGRMTLAVADTASPTRFTGITHFGDADVNRFGWINKDRLWFDATDSQSPAGDQLDNGLFAVNADGSGFAKLIDRRFEDRAKKTERGVLQGDRHRFVQVVGDGSDDVLVQHYEWVGEEAPLDTRLLRLNTKTREARNITPLGAPGGVVAWIVDQDGQPRVAVAGSLKTEQSVYWRNPANNAWLKLASFDSVDPAPGSYVPLAVDFDGKLFVSAIDPASGAAKTSALFRMGPQDGKLPAEPVLTLKGYDFDGEVLFDAATRKAGGVQYTSDAQGVAWFDPALRADQEAIDKQLDGTVNVFDCAPSCSSARHFIVTAYSDRQSPVYFLYERATRKLQLVASSRPWLDSAKMAEQDFVRIKARDGLEIPMLVTRPQGKGPWPAVVLVHGGPYVRGEEWGFASDTQFLASRGYLVLQPEFRGSRGYGDTLFRAGWRQWGLAMQDDVTDATRWAIAQGLADPKRIAIAGASYGGYAAMMGLVKEPALYRAGINWVGVTDIGLMYEIGWGDFMGTKWMRYGMPTLIGHQTRDAERFRLTSPLQQAARITQPVLMAYGELDRRVPLPHGTKLRDALASKGNKGVEWVEYEGEGHGWMLLKNKLDFWSRVETFLSRNLK